MKNTQLRTAEYVSPKHPDKMCDAISDAILQKYTEQDEKSRVAVETMGGHGRVYILGEVSSNTILQQKDYEKIVTSITGSDSYDVIVHISQQSSDIARGVDAGGAGDQGIVIGYACDENEEMLPQEYYLAKSLCNFLYEKYPYDGKTQITINEKSEVTHLVASFQNTKTDVLTQDIQEWIEMNKVVLSDDIQYFINPAGEWNLGGFDADTGLTGRKIVVDSYGPRVPVGGGAFSGKDWTKVDRSGARYARAIAQHLLKERNAHEVRVELAYAIGVSEALQSIAYIDGVPEHITEFDTSMKGIREFIQK